jgi:hypothetical protein
VEYFLIIWFGLGLVLAPFAYAGTLAYWQREWYVRAEEHYWGDVRQAVVFALFVLVTPINILSVAATMKFFKHGFKWK